MEMEKWDVGGAGVAVLNAPATRVDVELLELQKRQIALQVKQAERAEQEYETQERMKNEARRQGAESLQKERQMKLAHQANCAHQHPVGGGTGVRGQRNHQRVVMWVCQYCHKEWSGNDLPLHLRPDMSVVGGPEV